jgi:RNA polymerase sigma-70 factor (ECF subfamily)
MSDFLTLTDDELVAAVLGGQREAFKVLYERYLKRIYGLVYRMVGPQDAEEVTQECFMQAFRNLAKFRGEAQFYTWLYRVSSNTSLQHLRKRSRRESRQTSFDDLSENAPGVLAEATSSTYHDPQRAAEGSELQEQTRQAVETLPPNQKLVILLGPVRGLSYEEMAKVLDVTVPVVKARLHRARENLRRRVAAVRSGVQHTGPKHDKKSRNSEARGSSKGSNA